MTDKEIKILSVEDDEFMRIFLKDVFWIHGIDGKDNFSFKVVENLKKAREIINDPKSRPDIILLDLMLPEECDGTKDKEAGFHFLEELKSKQETKDIKVIIFSGFSDKEISEKALKYGADKFLLKGEYLPKELISSIKEILAK